MTKESNEKICRFVFGDKLLEVDVMLRNHKLWAIVKGEK